MILYTGGKTGGHIMPLIELMGTSCDKGIFVGQEGNLEEKICKDRNIEFISYPKYKSKHSICILGYFHLKKKLVGLSVDAIISTGGYVSIPLCLYGIKHHIPIYLLEENMILGKFNEWMYPFCKKMFWAYPPNKMKRKYVVTGLPIRKNYKTPEFIKYDILVIGGSLGSKVLCDIAYKLDKNYRICLIAGKYNKEYHSNERISVYSFTNDLYSFILSSKLVIARAGAATTAEVFYLNRPLICIPSKKTKRNHQYYNAIRFQEYGASYLFLEDEPIENLERLIQSIFENESIRVNMLQAQKKLVHVDACEEILKHVRGK